MNIESFKPPVEEEQNKSSEKGVLASIIGKAKESLETRAKWNEVKKLAEENGLEFSFKDEKDTRGAPISGSSGDVGVRRSEVTPEEATEFIKNLVKIRTEAGGSGKI